MITREKLLKLCTKIISRNFDGEFAITNFDLFETHDLNDNGDWYVSDYWIEIVVRVYSASKNDPSMLSKSSLEDLLQLYTGFEFSAEIM